MAIGATIGVERLRAGPHDTAVHRAMALKTEKRLGRVEQSAVDRTVRGVAIRAGLDHIAVLVDKRPALLHMAAGTGVPLIGALEQLGLGRTMGVMAVEATHPFFPERVMGIKAELGLDIRMAAVTELRHLILAYLLLRPFVQFVAGEATQVILGVNADMPKSQ